MWRAGRQGGGGVAARDGEGEGEVAGAEDGDRAEWDEHPPDVGSRSHRGLRRVVDGGLEVPAFAEGVGEEPELERRPGQLTLQADGTEPRLAVRLAAQYLGRALESARQRVQETGAPLSSPRAESGEGVLRAAHHLRDPIRAGGRQPAVVRLALVVRVVMVFVPLLGGIRRWRAPRRRTRGRSSGGQRSFPRSARPAGRQHACRSLGSARRPSSVRAPGTWRVQSLRIP